jgi:CBS domain-containing protein
VNLLLAGADGLKLFNGQAKPRVPAQHRLCRAWPSISLIGTSPAHRGLDLHQHAADKDSASFNSNPPGQRNFVMIAKDKTQANDSLRAKDIMTRDVVTVTEDSSVSDLASTLLEHRISAVPVVDASGGLLGIVSEGDLMHRAEAGTGRRHSWWLSLFTDSTAAAAEFVKEHSRRVGDVMTRNVVTAEPATPIFKIAEMLQANRIKRVPIVENGKVVGIVSRANLVQAMTRSPAASDEKATKDSQIQDRIMARLKAEPWSPVWLNVRVENGVVELWGAASSQAQKKAARLAAELTPGVVRVEDNIVVQSISY